MIEASVEQVLGSFQYPRAELDLRKYFALYERPDGSGRHVLTLSARAGWTGDNTPIYDRFYAGGFSTIRGFQFRGASPQEVGPSTGQDIVVGGDFQMLASAEYMFPITADDMVRGVVFCDTGTVEPNVNNWSNKYRVAPGFGLRAYEDRAAAIEEGEGLLRGYASVVHPRLLLDPLPESPRFARGRTRLVARRVARVLRGAPGGRGSALARLALLRRPRADDEDYDSA